MSGVLFLQIQLSDEFNVTHGHCACPRGQFRCHHMAALLVYGRDKISRTDVPCQWKVCWFSKSCISCLVFGSPLHVVVSRLLTVFVHCYGPVCKRDLTMLIID